MNASHDPAATWAGTIAATTACAVSGGIATDPSSDWYESLEKPSWQPPGYLFPIVWTGLYAGIAATSARTINTFEERGEQRRAAGYRTALGINLVLNQGWSWTFFSAHRLGLASVNAALLAMSSVDLARRAGQADTGKGLELVPYALWCTFATALTVWIARRNA
ncbi:TspO/MBR family protein [Kytococcus sedentarius]|uniref:TspO/MBR family protein n=1 Tax=Kytococcus sedentarius TaxID=1276 RepID=UPI0035BC0152